MQQLDKKDIVAESLLEQVKDYAGRLANSSALLVEARQEINRLNTELEKAQKELRDVMDKEVNKKKEK